MRNFMNNLKNPKYDFTGNFFKALIIPILVIIAGIVMFCTLGFNKSMELNGGTILTVVAEDDADLNKKDDYNELKKQVDNILKQHKLNGQTYQVVNISSVGMALTVKIDTRNLNDEQKTELNSSLLADIKSNIYASTSLDNDTIEDYVRVETFTGAKYSKVLLTSLLCSIIAIILVSAYLMWRVNISCGVTAIIFAILGNIFATALIVLFRIPLTVNTFIYIPVITIVSALMCYIMYGKTNDVLDESEDNRKLTSKKLANLVAGKSAFVLSAVFILVSLLVLIVGSFNMPNLRAISLSLCVSILAIVYMIIFMSPYVWALGYVKKAKKVKIQAKQDDKPEVNIMKDIMNEDITRN